jgi:hypothetical protein
MRKYDDCKSGKLKKDLESGQRGEYSDEETAADVQQKSTGAQQKQTQLQKRQLADQARIEQRSWMI